LLRAFKLAKGHSYSSILDLKVYGLSVSWQFHNFVGDVKLGFFVWFTVLSVEFRREFA
jgi:hypothetical protein